MVTRSSLGQQHVLIHTTTSSKEDRDTLRDKDKNRVINLYGLVVVKELGQVSTTDTPSSATSISTSGVANQNPQPTPVNAAKPEPSPSTAVTTHSSELTSGTTTTRSKTSIFTKTGDLAYRYLPGRYVLVAAGGAIKFFLGLEDTFEFTLGPSDVQPPPLPSTQGAGGDGGSAVPTAASAANQEIVSMDAFERKDERGCQLVLVVSIAKAEDPAQFELRFYGVNTFAPTIRELLLQLPATTDIQTIPLSWAPTKIIHSPLEDDPFEMVVLVGGSDSRVHVFVQDTPSSLSTSQDIMSSDGLFKEQSIDTLFSVLASFPYCDVLSLVIKDYLTYRVIAAGTQNGTLNVGIIPRDPVTFQLDRANAKAYTVVLFSPITTLTVYTSRVPTERKRQQQKYRRRDQKTDKDAEQAEYSGRSGQYAGSGDFGQEYDAEEEEEDEEEEEEGIHLVVTCAIEQAWVYSDINKHGLGRRADLAECSYHDSILAAHAMDADWDGQNEVLIGTYGRQLMVFKQLPPGQEPYPTPQGSSSVHQQKQSQHSQHHHHSHQYQQQQRSSTQQLQRQLRNSFQLQQQIQLQQLQQQQQQQQYQQQQIHLSGPTVSSPSALSIGNNGTATGGGQFLSPQWGMTWNRRFASPVYGISSADLNDDGLEELVITTINGVSFFLPDPRTAKRRLAQAVERMREIKEMRTILAQLRRDNRKLVEDQRVKEEKEEEERRKEAEEAERKVAEEKKEAERKAAEEREEAERKEKERRDQEDLEKKDLEELEERKALEEQQLREQHQEQDELEKEAPKQQQKDQEEEDQQLSGEKQGQAEAEEKKNTEAANTAVDDNGDDEEKVEQAQAEDAEVLKDTVVRSEVFTAESKGDEEDGDEKLGSVAESRDSEEKKEQVEIAEAEESAKAEAEAELEPSVVGEVYEDGQVMYHGEEMPTVIKAESSSSSGSAK
ncbi:hypothetical protein BGX23_012505 [Mortierella sp. AD031]|nr:hypothetical protein BGX23_012505 [Mortierella sp. AD031]